MRDRLSGAVVTDCPVETKRSASFQVAVVDTVNGGAGETRKQPGGQQSRWLRVHKAALQLRSTMSAKAPARSANINIGDAMAAWTSATRNGSGASDVINRPSPVTIASVPDPPPSYS